uniref:Receptor expression-enhancing protein n=1 Tax=Euplotes harpa TaxID=151035 RepID=A0A7S3NAN0_9SPIT
MLGYVWDWLQYLIVIFVSLLYPLYRSSRMVKKKENSANLHILMKYWVIYSILYFMDCYLKLIIESVFPFYDFMQLVVFITLVVNNFKVSTLLYDNVIHTFFSFNEAVIDGYLKAMNDKIANSKDAAVENSKSWLTNFVRTTLVPLISKFMFQNPQEPENNSKVNTPKKEKYSGNPVDDDANQ